jgi:hypothetical protein
MFMHNFKLAEETTIDEKNRTIKGCNPLSTSTGQHSTWTLFYFYWLYTGKKNHTEDASKID